MPVTALVEPWCCFQVARGVVFRSYEVRVDRMTVLRGNVSEEAALFASISAAATPVVSAVVFRCASFLGSLASKQLQPALQRYQMQAAARGVLLSMSAPNRFTKLRLYVASGRHNPLMIKG